MKQALERRPADFVHAELGEERLREMWSGIERAEERVRARDGRVRLATGVALLLCAAVLALLVVRTSRSPESSSKVATSRSVPSTNDGARQLSLSDGSTLFLNAETRAHVVAMTQEEVRVRLEQGTVVCEVPVDHHRRFVVEAAGFEVVVRGTRFTVSLGIDEPLPTGVVVSVERGSVEVREPPDRVLAVLGPGQRWASEANSSTRAPLRSAATPCPTCPVAPPAASAVPVLPAASGPRAIFERANAARLAGNARDAAAAFEELRERYPADARAGYAAFMLGRIRLDTLGDPNGAVDAFSFADSHPGGGFFLEDAEARLIEAFAKAGRSAECRQARDQFLESHPHTPRAERLSKQCDAR